MNGRTDIARRIRSKIMALPPLDLPPGRACFRCIGRWRTSGVFEGLELR